MKTSLRVLFCLVLGGCLSAAALAQSDKAGMNGTITDAQGAAVAGAKVTVKNVDTGYTFTTTTSSDGRYDVPLVLKPGRYTVEATKEGFKTEVSQEVVLQIGDVREVSLVLQIGAVAETVTVSAEAPLLQTDTSEVGAVITGRQITDLPLKDRNFTQLATLTPGVSRAIVGVLTDATAFNQGDTRFGQGDVSGSSNNQGSTEASRFSRSSGASITVNGLRPTNNNFSLDGVDNNEPQFGTIGVFPNPDAIQEFKVETSIPKAEVGRGGAVINTTYQSGTNDLHGDVFYYGQNDFLNANHWELNKLREDLVHKNHLTPQQAQGQLPDSHFRVNEFGFTVGGPIKKNRTFFFFDYLGQRNATPNPFRTVVPTAKSRMGDFSEFNKPSEQIIDPLSCATPGNIASGGCMTFVQETGQNVIPNLQSRPDFTPQAFKLFALYPLPTINVLDPECGNFNYFGLRNNIEHINSFDVKIDHKISNSNTITGRFTRDNQERDRANFFPKVPTAGFGAGNELGNTRQLVVSDTHVFKPTLLNEVKFGWTKIEINILNCGVEGSCGVSPTACMDLGIPNCNHGTPASTGGILTGGFGTGFFEFTGDGGLFQVKSNNFYISDNVTMITGGGKHTWKAGFELRPRYLDTIDGGRSGGLKGQLQYGAGQPQSTGNVQSDYLLGRPAIFASDGVITGGDNPFNLRFTEWSFYIQDDWKATPALTLNLGVRYDIFRPPSEADSRIANFDPISDRLIVAGGSKDRLIDTAYHNIGPRVGFAYNFGPRKQYVLRGGYGIYYSSDGVDYPPVIRNPPLTSSVAENGGGFFGGTSDFNLMTGPPVPPAATTTITSSTTLFTQEISQKVATIHEWNLTGEWEFARNWLVDVGYIGTRGRHLLATRELGNNGAGLGLARVPGCVGAVGSSTCVINTDTAYENRASSNYNGLQAQVQKRFSRGVQFRAAYTYSHDIDDSTGVFGGLGDTRGTNGGPADPLNFRLERANSSLDHRHLFSSNLIWDLPLGKGRWLGGNASGVADKLLSGWQANFIWLAQSGQPFSVSINGSGTRANVICADPRAGAPAGFYLNPACFSTPQFTMAACPGAPGQSVPVGAVAPALFVRNLSGIVDSGVPLCGLGNVGTPILVGNGGRNEFVGPGLFRTDFSLYKNTTFHERYRLQIGLEFFNVTNSTFNIVPNNNFSNGDFGIFDSAFPPRTIQYRAKIFF